jgi:hypothetical protein
MMPFALTTGSGIPGALIRANDHGVNVRLIAGRWSTCELREGITPLVSARIPESRFVEKGSSEW